MIIPIMLIATALYAWPAVADKPAAADKIEEPTWRLLDTFGSVEIRRYEPSIQARTQLTDSGETSGGFQRLAGFIFGDNSTSQKIAMTAPVQETLVEDAPVMAFTMPGQYSLGDLPEPADPRVSLAEVPARTVAVIRFSGWATGSRVKSRTRELLTTLQARNIAVVGVPSLNQYNPPWTLPFLRRNEIMVEVNEPANAPAAR